MDDFFSARKVGMACDLVEMVDVTFAEQARALVAGGALVSIGTTRDGGALSITVTHNGQWRREYLTSVDDLRAFLNAAQVAVEAAGPPVPAPTYQGSNTRARRAR